MTDNNYIGGLEEMVMLAIQHLNDDAYGASIHKVLWEAGRRTNIGSLYITLGRLEDKGYVTSKLGEPLPERSGRSKKYYKLTGTGERVLADAELSRNKLRLEWGGGMTWTGI